MLAGAAVILSLAKFIATYACLEGDWTIDNPPLPRTQSTKVDAETRTITCRLHWNVPALMQALKEWRTQINAVAEFAVDVDINDSSDSRATRRWWVGHTLKTVTMDLRPTFPESARPSPEALAMAPPEMRAKMLAMLANQIFLASDVLYVHSGNDRERDDGVTTDGCGTLSSEKWNRVADLSWQDTSDPFRQDAEGRSVGWNVEQVLQNYPRQPAPMFNAKLTVDVAAGAFKIEGPDLALLALATTENSRSDAPPKAGLILVPLAPGERELPAKTGHLVDAEGALPQAVAEVLRDPWRARAGATKSAPAVVTHKPAGWWRRAWACGPSTSISPSSPGSPSQSVMRGPASVRNAWLCVSETISVPSGRYARPPMNSTSNVPALLWPLVAGQVSRRNLPPERVRVGYGRVITMGMALYAGGFISSGATSRTCCAKYQ